MLRHHLPIVAAVACGVSILSAAEPEPVDPATLAAVQKLTLRVTFRQVIGRFASFQGPAVGDTLELDLGALPADRLRAESPREGVRPYVSLPAALQIVEVRRTAPPAERERTLIRLAAEARDQRCRIAIAADGLKPGDKVRLTLATNDGFLGSLGEAEGEWK